jgi:hypothetical protein
MVKSLLVIFFSIFFPLSLGVSCWPFPISILINVQNLRPATLCGKNKGCMQLNVWTLS